MDKRFSKIFLITVSLIMILIIFSLSIITKDHIEIEDISGDRDALGDMNIVYQKRRGMYETDNIIISKDDERIKRYVKEGVVNFSITKENINDRELLQYANNKSSLCETEDEITNVTFYNSYSTYDEDQMTVYIDIKDKKSSSIKNYEITIDNNANSDIGSIYQVLPIRNNDNIYLAIISSTYENENKLLDDESNMYKQTYLSLFKLNLSSQQYKCILTKSYESSEMYINGETGFVKDNVAYFVTSVRNDETNEMNTCLFAFNIMTKDINIINLGIGNQNINNYYLDDNEVLLSCDIDQNTSMMKTIVVNLDDKKVARSNEIYVRSNGKNDRYALEVRRDKGKIYLVMGDDEYLDYSGGITDMNYYIYVIDEKSNEILYSGKIKEKIIYSVGFGIVKDEEL